MAIIDTSKVTVMVSSLIGEKVLSAVVKVLKDDNELLEKDFKQLEKVAAHVDLFRDAAGRLVSVKATVPSELIGTVTPHLLTIPGVIDVSSGDIVPVGMVGIDGTTVPLVQAFKAYGVNVFVDAPLTETTDGDISSSVFAGTEVHDICISGPDAKYKFPNSAAVSRMIAILEVLGDSPIWTLEMSNREKKGASVSVSAGSAAWGQSSFTVSAGLHTYDMRIQNNGASAELIFDGVSKGVISTVDLHGSGTFKLHAVDTHGIKLDNWSWGPRI